MENSLTRWLYDHSPVVLQHLYTTAYGWRKRLQRYRGREFQAYCKFFDECRSWNAAELRAWQDEQLREVISEAYEHVPFYRRRFDSLSLTPGDIRSVDDLPKLPLLTKEDVRRAGKDLFADNYPKGKGHIGPSSGSTGFPITIWHSARSLHMEYAFHWARRRPGVHYGQRYASFTGLEICRADSMKPPLWRVNMAANQRCYSIFHMTDETMPLYLDDLQKHPCAWFEGYATPIYLLARYILDTGYTFTAYPRAVFPTSEQLQPGYREVIEQAFQTRVYDQYGMHEKVASITEYECGHLHDDMEYGIAEFLPKEKQDGGTVCEIIGTCLANEAMPLIRYQVGDMALLPDHPPACDAHAGRIVSQIHGRTNHVLVTGDGRKVANISVIATRMANVVAVQCVQDEIGKVRVLVVRAVGYTADDERNLLHQFRQKMGQALDITIEHVGELQRTSSGKTLQIISNVGRESTGNTGPGRHDRARPDDLV